MTSRAFALAATVLALVILAALNVVLLLPNLDFYRRARSPLHAARERAAAVAAHHHEAARRAGLADRRDVAEALARLGTDAGSAADEAGVRAAEMRWGSVVSAAVADHERSEALGRIVEVLRDEPSVRSGRGGLIAVFPAGSGDGVEVADPAGLISEKGRQRLVRDERAGRIGQRIEFEALRGVVAPVAASVLAARVRTLEAERMALEKAVRIFEDASAWTEREGAGIVIRMHDARGKGDESFVHDADVRTVVNELYASGAAAVDVSGARLRTGSWIRCVGPVLQVDGRPVAVGPVVVRAIGDPNVLAKALEILRRALSEYNVRLTVEKQRKIRMAPAPREGR